MPSAPSEFNVPLPDVEKTVCRRLISIVLTVGSPDRGPAVPAVPPDVPGVAEVKESRVSARLLNAVTNEERAVWTADWLTPTVSVSVSPTGL